MMKQDSGKKNLKFVCILSLVLMSYISYAQVNISGPTCILPGKVYQYNINASWNSSSTMRICIKGGKLQSGSSCTPIGTISSLVFIIWDSTGSQNMGRKIELTSSSGNATLTVQGTTELQGGQINSEDKTQVYNKDKTVYNFHCSAASGGACVPFYYYQWQKSENGLNWKNIDGATTKSFQFSGSIIVNTFFRRMTTEAHSNTIAYSDLAVLSVEFLK